LQEDEQGLLIAGAGAAGVLIDDYLYFLGGGREGKQQSE
jgi:hypothetical protein